MLEDARRFLQLNFELINQYPLQMYDFAHIWIPEKSLMLEQYTSVLHHTPRVLFGLSQSWQPLVNVIRIQDALTVNSVAFSPDSSRLASGSDNTVQIWNTATGELEDELEGHTVHVESVAFSHNSRFIVSGSWDNTVRIWNTATSKTTYTLMGHTHAVMSVAISRNDMFVVSGSGDMTVRMWDTATGGLLRELKGHTDEVVSVAVSPDCQHVASVSGTGKLWIWTKDGDIKHRLECLINKSYDLAFSHDGLRILCSQNRTEWTTTGHRLFAPDTVNDPDHRELTMSVAYSPDDGEIACGMEDGMVGIWNKDTNETRMLGRHSSGVKSIAFSPDGSRIASGSYHGTVRIWDPRLRETINEEYLERLSSVVMSHDSRWIVSVSGSHIQVWRVTESVIKANELITKDDVTSLALSHDGSRVVIGSGVGSIWVWNHLTHMVECQMSGHFSGVRCVAFSYDGRHLVSGSLDKTVRTWDCHTGNEVSLYQNLSGVVCVAFSRDGDRVAFGSLDGAVQIWNPSTGQTQRMLDRNSERQDWVYSIAFSHDDRHVISGSPLSREVFIWNVTANNSTRLSERIRLPDGTRVHSLRYGKFHIYDPVDQETTNDIPPYLLSISPDHDWILGEQAEHNCWIPPQYRDFNMVHIAKSIVCLGYVRKRIIVLDLKSIQHVL